MKLFLADPLGILSKIKLAAATNYKNTYTSLLIIITKSFNYIYSFWALMY